MKMGWLQEDSPVSGVMPTHPSTTPVNFLRLLSASLWLVVLLAVPMKSATASQGKLSFSASALQFGNVTVGASHSVSLKITNTGKANVAFSHEYLKGTGYSLIGFHLPLTLSPGKSLNVIVKFAPAKAGEVRGGIYLGSNASNSSVNISLDGKGIAASTNHGSFSAVPGSANFTSVPVGTSNTQTITLKNVGSTKATISGFKVTGGTFQVSGLSVPRTVGAGQTTSFQIVFSPAQSQQYSGQVTVSVDTSQKYLNIAATGKGIADTRMVSITPTFVNFGNVVLGTQTNARVQLQNTGNSSVTISRVALSGTGFSETGLGSGLVLGPNQSAVLNVAFSPGTVGAKTGAITITSNAANSVASVALSGAGITTTAHTVQLTWQASSSPGVIGYNIYRAASQTGAFAKCNGGVVGGTAFADNTVQSGQTYLYQVTTLASGGVESAPSDPVNVSIP